MDNIPRMHFTSGADSESDAPEAFTERILQTRLMLIWSRIKKSQAESGPAYNPTKAQELHSWFQKDYVDTLPPAFSFTNPDYRWDEKVRHLPKQRQLIRATIGESICHLFRPLLLLSAPQVQAMPVGEQALLTAQTKDLAAAAFCILDASTKLHDMVGAMHTRLPAVVVYRFEAAVTLALICIKDLVAEESRDARSDPYSNLKTVPNSTSTYAAPLEEDVVTAGQRMTTQPRPVSRRACITAVEESLCHLKHLSQISELAVRAVQSLERLLSKIHNLSERCSDAEDESTRDATLLSSTSGSMEESSLFFAFDPDMNLSQWLPEISGLNSTTEARIDTVGVDETVPLDLSLANDPWGIFCQNTPSVNWNHSIGNM